MFVYRVSEITDINRKINVFLSLWRGTHYYLQEKYGKLLDK